MCVCAQKPQGLLHHTVVNLTATGRAPAGGTRPGLVTQADHLIIMKLMLFNEDDRSQPSTRYRRA